ncbi:MAG: hypothetical protein NVS2B12_38490 [Ktedonobacteraceae bacterium]
MFKYIGRLLLIVGLVGIFIIAYLVFGGQARPAEDTASIAIIATTLCAVLGQLIIQNTQGTAQQEPISTEIFTRDGGKDVP